MENLLTPPAPKGVPVAEYVTGTFVPISHLAHGWEMHAAVPLTRAEERSMVREPAQAVPEGVAKRLANLRVLLVPYVGCAENGDLVCFVKPAGETHSSVWLDTEDRVNLILPCRELDPHDTGFEFLASVAELLHPRLAETELATYTQLLDEELRAGIPGEIDEDSLLAKEPLMKRRVQRRARAAFERYRDISFAGTMAEYMHGLWHDVQIRVGPEHLPLPQLRRRMELLAGMFPPNQGYRVFADELRLEGQEAADKNSEE